MKRLTARKQQESLQIVCQSNTSEQSAGKTANRVNSKQNCGVVHASRRPKAAEGHASRRRTLWLTTGERTHNDTMATQKYDSHVHKKETVRKRKRNTKKNVHESPTLTLTMTLTATYSNHMGVVIDVMVMKIQFEMMVSMMKRLNSVRLVKKNEQFNLKNHHNLNLRNLCLQGDLNLRSLVGHLVYVFKLSSHVLMIPKVATSSLKNSFNFLLSSLTIRILLLVLEK